MKKLFILFLGITLIACGSDDDGGSSPSSNTPTAEFYITANMDGSNIMYEVAAPFTMIHNNSAELSLDEGCEFDYGTTIANESQDTYVPSFSIAFANWVKAAPGNCTDDDYFASSFLEESVSYAYGSMRGVVLEYRTAEDILYSSAFGSQNSESFEITSVEINEATMFTLMTADIKGTFSGKLYNSSSASMDVTNGTFSLRIQSSSY